MNPLVLIALAFVFADSGASATGTPKPKPKPKPPSDYGGADEPEDDGGCPQGSPIVYDGPTLHHDANPTTDPELTHLERLAVNDVLATVASDDGYPQPGQGLCTREALASRLGVTTWAGILAMLIIWRLNYSGQTKGKSWGQLNEAQKYRYSLVRESVERLMLERDADEQVDVDVAQVNAAAQYLAAVKPESAYSLPDEWALARKPPPFSKKGQSNPQQQWDEWLTNLLYWRFYPHLPIKVAGPGSPGAVEWHGLHAVMVGALA